MSETKSSCSHDCEHCTENCSDRSIPKDQANEATKIGKIIAVVSGKGGVGKSTVAGLIARDLHKAGYAVGILDGDLTGPSIPKMFGVSGSLMSDGKYTYPLATGEGIKIISANLMVQDAETPVIWRGPLLASLVRQFFTEVNWGELDYLIIDLPPGTGDVPLTVFQSLPINGIIVVTTPQELVSMIVMKAVNMAKMMNIPIIGAVENMSYVTCPDCGKQIEVFGPSSLGSLEKSGIVPLDRLAIDADTVKKADQGRFFESGLSVPLAVEAIGKL